MSFTPSGSSPLLPGSENYDSLETITGKLTLQELIVDTFTIPNLTVTNATFDTIITTNLTIINQITSVSLNTTTLQLNSGTISTITSNPLSIVNKAYVDSNIPQSLPGGPTNSLQFNDSGVFGGSSDLLWDSVTQTLTLDGTLESPEGSQLVLRTPNRTVAQPGTQIVLQSGDGGSGEDGGGITLGGGDGEGGGGITLEGGTALGSLDGGWVFLRGGENQGSGPHGSVQVGGNLEQIPQWGPKVVGSVVDPTNLNEASIVDVQCCYAYVVTLSTPTHFTVVNVSNPLNPLIVSSQTPGGGFDGSGSSRIMVLGRYVYTISPISNQLTIWDVSDPYLPVIVGTLVDVALTDTRDFDIVPPYLFATSQAGNSVSSLYIGNPQQPTLLDTLVDLTDLGSPLGIRVSGNYAYIVAPANNKFTIVDVSNPSGLTKVGVLTNSAITFFSQVPQVQGPYAYIPVANTSRIIIVDVSDPTTPIIVTQFANISLSNIGLLALAGNYAYAGITTNPNAIVVLDLTNPILPTLVGQGTTGTSNFKSISFQGRYAYVCTGGTEDTLWVFDLGGSTLLGTQMDNLETAQLISGGISVGNNISSGTMVFESLGIPGLCRANSMTVKGIPAGLMAFTCQGTGTFGSGLALSWGDSNSSGGRMPIPFDMRLIYFTVRTGSVSTVDFVIRENLINTSGTISLTASQIGIANIDVTISAGNYIDIIPTSGLVVNSVVAVVYGYFIS